jgi:PEP-CTERM motif
MRKSMALTITASALAFASPALAATFDVVTGYNTAPFTYGSGTGGATFAAFSTNYSGGCQGQAAFSCHADVSPFNLPAVGKNLGATTVNFATVTLPNDVVYFHPGSIAGEDAILRFTAATTDIYTLNGSFIRLDSTPTPNGGQDGVLASIFKVSGSTYTSLYSNVLVGSLNSSIGFTGLSTTLAAGDYVEFVVNRRTAFNTDSTGLKATITSRGAVGAVPEPATWAMMLFGFGLVGSLMRRRNATRICATV